MKKLKLVIITLLALLISVDVFACGEIDELRSNIGTVSVIDSSNYLVTIPKGTTEVTLTGSTKYDWVEGFAPRKVSTLKRAELKVDGNACGYGIYTYFVKFKELSNIIAENDTPPADNNTTNNNTSTNPNPTTPPTTTTTTDPNAPIDPNKKEITLSKLTIKDVDLAFEPAKKEYAFEVDADVTSLEIEAIPENETITVITSTNAKELKEGENLVTITLNDEQGNTNTYNLKVTKLKAKSNNNYLASIVITGHQFNFDASTFEYTLAIKKEKMLDIQVVTESELATYDILGNANLDDGSTITIRVTAEDGTSRDYIINIVKNFDIMDYWIYIVLVLLVLLILILLLIMNQKKKKQAKKLGPEAIQGEANTAGVVQEIASTIAPETPAQTQTTDTPVAQPGTLNIIEPTNIEAPAATEAPTETAVDPNTTTSATETTVSPAITPTPVDEDSSRTEVFKL